MNIALLFAGGRGDRMYTSKKPKQFIKVDGKPIIIHSIENFEKHSQIDKICVVCIDSWIDKCREYIYQFGLKKVEWIVPGGATGQQSIYNGLKAVSDNVGEKNNIVLISDGVRPIVSDNIITQCLECVKKYGSCVTVCPVPETIVIINVQDEIIDIPKRNDCYLSKAPQGFWLSEIMDAHRIANKENRFDCTNSAELIRRYGHSLHVIYDNEENIKVTNPIDIAIMKYILERKSTNEF